MENPDPIQRLGALAVGSRLRRVSDRIMSEGVKVYRSAGLEFEPRWFPLYQWLLEHGGCTVGEASQALGVSQPAVTQIVRRMSQRGMVTSRRDKHDGRLRRLSLSRRGRDLRPALETLWSDLKQAAEGLLSESENEVLSALTGLEAALDRKSLFARYQEVACHQLPQVVIDDYETHDHDAFRSLNLEWLEKYFSVEQTDRYYLDNPEATILETGGAIFMARLHLGGRSETIGTCSLVRHGEGIYELAKMAVAEKAQGRGVGTLLGKKVVERAKALGAKKLILESNSRLGPAIRIYRKLGFEHTPRAGDSVYERADTYMELDLSPPSSTAGIAR